MYVVFDVNEKLIQKNEANHCLWSTFHIQATHILPSQSTLDYIGIMLCNS